MWRKNRRPSRHECEGVDLDRNFPFDWDGAGSSSDPCDDTFRGPSQFSEPETRALRDYIMSLRWHIYIAFHSYGQ